MTNRSRKIKTAVCLSFGLFITALASSAAIDPYSEDFSSESGLNGWIKMQDAPDTRVQWASDQVMIVNIQDEIMGNESVGYTAAGTLKKREKIEVSVRLVNLRNVYYKARVQLWNASTNVLLVESEPITVYGSDDPHGRYAPVGIELTYQAQSSDDGASLQLRVKEESNGSQRNIMVDSISISSK